MGELSAINPYDDSPATNSGKGKGGKKHNLRKCKAKLRHKNKKEHEGNIDVIGDIEFLSGLNLQTQGFGIFDRKWFIESSAHEIKGNGGYITKLKMRGCLEGY